MKSTIYYRSWDTPTEHSDESVTIYIRISEDYLDCMIEFCTRQLQNINLTDISTETLDRVKQFTENLRNLFEAKESFNDYNTAKGVQEFLDEVKED